VAELADALDSKSSTFGCVGSTPSIGTISSEGYIHLQVVQLVRFKASASICEYISLSSTTHWRHFICAAPGFLRSREQSGKIYVHQKGQPLPGTGLTRKEDIYLRRCTQLYYVTDHGNLSIKCKQKKTASFYMYQNHSFLCQCDHLKFGIMRSDGELNESQIV
jgi:hypothetical protein